MEKIITPKQFLELNEILGMTYVNQFYGKEIILNKKIKKFIRTKIIKVKFDECEILPTLYIDLIKKHKIKEYNNYFQRDSYYFHVEVMSKDYEENMEKLNKALKILGWL